jgi:cell division protease FtsH
VASDDIVARILSVAAGEALTSGSSQITPTHILVALSKLSDDQLQGGREDDGSALRREFESLGIEPRRFRRRLRALMPHGRGMSPESIVHRSATAKAVFGLADALAESTGEPSGPVHLLRAIFALLADAEGRRTGGTAPVDDDRGAAPLAKPAGDESRPPGLGALTRRLRTLRQDLLGQVYCQDHAIQRFVEGLFNVEMAASADASRRKPAGLFVFAGPPGVGKTYLAELAAARLDRPFSRFDMSAFSHSHEVSGLVGTPKMYHGAQPGGLTGFVQQHPNALLLFDEIEKAHHSAVHLFLQVLDAGRLQDKFTEQNVEFRDTIIIFTTNVGRALYEHENASGIHAAHAAFHQATILDALRTEVDPRTQTPFFPAAICSRIATGYPILFNRLSVDGLCQIVQAEISRVSRLIGAQYGLTLQVQEEIPVALVMREGGHTDARTMKARGDAFLKEEVFKTCQLFSDERIDQAFGALKEISIEIDQECPGAAAERLFRDTKPPEVLLVGAELLGHFCRQSVPEVEWTVAANREQVFDVLAKRSVDFVLLDLALQEPSSDAALSRLFLDVSAEDPVQKTEAIFDYAPPASRAYAAGQQVLEQLHSRMPEVPVHLLSIEQNSSGLPGTTIDEELFMACVRAGGARGVIRTPVGGLTLADLQAARAALAEHIVDVARRLRRERLAAELAASGQVVSFDTAPAASADGRRLRIRCRNIRLARAVRSADAGAVLSDAERPATRFADVVGAKAAKDSLAILRDWLADPKAFAAAGVDPPRGVLLIGPPGTGKTMLARALAGESSCAFLPEAATTFVTKYTGSGPEAVRDLFTRARRYAPSIVFIDEIDAIGRSRESVGPGRVGHAEALTLNQLLVDMDGFSKASARPVIVLAATNRPETLDPALVRRFSRVIEVELPTRTEREAYLRSRLEAKAAHEVSAAMIQRLAVQSQGMSVADLERVLAHAAVMALSNRGVIGDSLLADAFETVTMGEARASSDPLRTARHEAGHAVVMCVTGRPPVYVTIVGRGDFGGYAAPDDREDRRSRTRRELEDQICQLMGGREAECLYYGQEDGVSTGPSSDLERATRIAEAMVYELGMSKDIGFIKIDRKDALPDEVAGKCHAVVQGILQTAGARTRQLLETHRPSLDRIVEALMDRNRLLKHEVLALMEPAGPVVEGD